MKKVILSLSVVLISLLLGCSSSKNIGSTSMPDPKVESSKVSVKDGSNYSSIDNSKDGVSATTEGASTSTAKSKSGKSGVIVVREERVKILEEVGTPVEPGKYYVIMGSFRVLENARNFKKQLIIDGFNPLLLQNDAGLYRVAAGTFSQESPSRDRIDAIRNQSDKYDDVWLLVQKQ